LTWIGEKPCPDFGLDGWRYRRLDDELGHLFGARVVLWLADDRDLGGQERQGQGGLRRVAADNAPWSALALATPSYPSHSECKSRAPDCFHRNPTHPARRSCRREHNCRHWG
jgi:hypothetical protein